MSFGMDDLSRSYGVDPTLQTRLIDEIKNADGKPVANKTSVSEQTEPEVNDVFEKTKEKQKVVKQTFDGIQKESSSIDIVKRSLEKISASVDDVKKIVKSEEPPEDSKQKIDENYKKIKQIAEETSFDNKKLIKESKDNDDKTLSLEEMKISDIENLKIQTPKQREEAKAKLDEIEENIKNKQDELARKQESLAQTINQNSLVELEIAPSIQNPEKDIEKTEQVPPEKLKESTIKGINENPEKSIQMHIKHIDKNLLLAMLSLRMA